MTRKPALSSRHLLFKAGDLIYPYSELASPCTALAIPISILPRHFNQPLSLPLCPRLLAKRDPPRPSSPRADPPAEAAHVFQPSRSNDGQSPGRGRVNKRGTPLGPLDGFRYSRRGSYVNALRASGDPAFLGDKASGSLRTSHCTFPSALLVVSLRYRVR